MAMSKRDQDNASTVRLNRQYAKFILMIARLVKDGERQEDGTEFDMPSDDAVDTLHSLITQARALVEEPEDRR